jgi:hypothetical protein
MNHGLWVRLSPMSSMPKHNRRFPAHQHGGLSGIVYILAFLLGVLLFLIFGDSLLGVKPEPIWIALLMGLSVSAIMFWVWCEIRNTNKDDKDD